MTAQADRALLDAVASIARRAGALILDVYERPFEVQHKADGSPVTEADARAEALIVGALQALTPGVPVVAEEAHAAGTLPAAAAIAARLWLVDPLDGTREFAARNGEFTVNIALVEHGAPVLGVVAAPALGCLYAGEVGAGAWRERGGRREPIHTRERPAAGATVVLSRSHLNAATEAWLRGRAVASRVGAGSSLKFGLVAAGEADWYPRLSRTMEWDTAAGHAVLRAAGGEVRTLDGAPLGYGKPGLENPHFVAHGAGPWPG